MEREQRSGLNKEHRRQNNLNTMARGFTSIRSDKKKRNFLFFESLLLLFTWVNRHSIEALLMGGNTYEPLSFLFNGALLVVLLLITLITMFIFGVPFYAKEIEKNLRRINFVNEADEVPTLINYSKSEGNKDIVILQFQTCGIPVPTWKNKIAELESAIDCNILDIYESNSKRKIIVEAIPSKIKLPDFIEWNDSFCSNEDFKIAIGQGLAERVYWDMSVIPHALIGGGTGSGKTILIKCLIYQCLMKNAQVYLADFKGGIDFGEYWKSRCAEILTDKEAFLKRLELLNLTLEHRRDVFKQANYENIAKFNEKSTVMMPRIILVCDELAAIMTNPGADKEKKDYICRIENYLSTIACQGRAYGIHLVISTQRPDANIVDGQIKNNLDYRICGRADNVLSRIILDNTSASDSIPKKSQGRFVTGEGKIVQSYYFSEESSAK